ncbi:MAG: type II toxin-antitoxin system YafQ family toxin [Sulfurovaceae bacterium]|nr:type II toxin-antitoxin system YafQ family toxin [Sulfurovaceae bacterium]
MKYQLDRSNGFKRSFKKRKLTDDEESNYIEVLYKLLNDEELPIKYKDHLLKGNLKEYRECHIKPDLLLVYKIDREILELIDIGSHNYLFDK